MTDKPKVVTLDLEELDPAVQDHSYINVSHAEVQTICLYSIGVSLARIAKYLEERKSDE